MLGSHHDGEIAAAGRAADRLVRASGLTWADVVAVPAEPALTHERDAEAVDDAINFAMDHADVLTPWERQFCCSLRRQRRRLSAKQKGVLHDIVDKARTAEMRAAA